MTNTIGENSINCEREKVIAYLDGEFSASEELRFEAHLAGCNDCLAELNEQKRLLNALETAFEENLVFDDKTEIELPKDFAKKIATRAESDFQGLRRPSNWLHAALLTFGLFGFGFMVGKLLKKSEFPSILLDQSAAIVIALGNFLVTILFDISLSFVVILRTLSRHILIHSGYSLILPIIFFIISFFILSRLLLRFPKN